MKRFKAVFFDLGGVLSLGKRSKGVHEFVAEKLKISMDQYLDSIDDLYSMAISGQISSAGAIKLMARNLGISASRLEKIYLLAYKKNFKRDDRLYSFAMNLKKKGYKIAIISDIWEIARESILTKKDYRGFNHIITSYEVGSRKTDKKIFQIALRKLKVKPSEAIFTDNRSWNMIAPKKLGITSILYKNSKQFIQELKKLGITV